MAPDTGARVELRERVHLREGRPAETESVYWHTLGGRQSDFRYLCWSYRPPRVNQHSSAPAQIPIFSISSTVTSSAVRS